MGRLQKKQLMENVSMLGEACHVLEQQSMGPVYVNLCADIQEFISAICNFLESITGEETETAGLLCELYQLLFRVSQGEAQANQLISCVKKIETCAYEELRLNQMEAAFFCYKASMSDCLESIYFAAKEDPAWDPYFIPIPYYDRNPDGSLGEMHYEGEGCYSPRYQLVDWRSYDVKARKPDVVYIMAPFDEYNLVTSVHPDFYASRLKGCTDLLVYIPYIVHSEVVDLSAGSFPGVRFSHKVIVQSENVRKQYIHSLIHPSQGLTPEMAEEKVVALGSPKTDKVWNSRKRDYTLPEEWSRMLGEDGSKKLVLLYNLSIETALTYSQGEAGDRYLKKLRSIFQFVQNHKEVVLWWRPHPLLAQTFRSMRPGLYQEYEELVKDYQERGLGIYDDSADMNRAIAYADACYGDESSLNLLLQFAGKPVLIQDIKNGGRETAAGEGEACVERAMDAFIAREHYNSYILYEGWDASNGGVSLAGFIRHLDVILKWSTEQSMKYRKRYENGDGTAGQKIHEYISQVLRRMDHE